MNTSSVYIVEVVVQNTVIENDKDSGVIQTTESTNEIVTDSGKVELIEVGTQGPPGAGGTGNGTSQEYDQRADTVSNYVVYRAEAVPGSADTAQVWRISKIVITYGNVISTTTTHPDGDSGFNYAWTDRGTYTYG